MSFRVHIEQTPQKPHQKGESGRKRIFKASADGPRPDCRELSARRVASALSAPRSRSREGRSVRELSEVPPAPTDTQRREMALVDSAAWDPAKGDERSLFPVAKSWQTRTFFCLSRRKERKQGEHDPFCEPWGKDGTRSWSPGEVSPLNLLGHF